MSGDGAALGIDFGTVRIGVAVSDEVGIAARPYTVIPVDGDEVSAITRLVEELAVRRVVVGLPRTLAGVEGSSAEGARALAGALAESIEMPVEFADERFTTSRAEDLLKATTRDRRDRRAKVDAVAASVMLQGWLDAEAAKRRGNPRYSAKE